MIYDFLSNCNVDLNFAKILWQEIQNLVSRSSFEIFSATFNFNIEINETRILLLRKWWETDILVGCKRVFDMENFAFQDFFIKEI